VPMTSNEAGTGRGSSLPSYDELPPGPTGGRLGWGVFGEGDLGAIAMLTPERVAAAAGLVKRGVSFALDATTNLFSPALASGRGTGRHTVISAEGSIGMDDVWDNVYPQAGSQWDSLAHFGHADGRWYNGVTREEILQDGRNSIHRWAEHGIAGRAVLLDMPSTFAAQGREYDPGSTVAYTVADLEAAQELAGATLGEGDILLINTGFGAWYTRQPAAARTAMPRRLTCPGIEHTEDMARYLWDLHIAVAASDTFAVECWPADFSPSAAPFGFLHQMLIGSFGIALGELWWLQDLADDCLATGVHEGLLVAAPINAVGGIGSTANAVMFK
jgi:kynurenine formamidase